MGIMLKKNVSMALATMRASRGRSLLTMLGVVIAVASVTIIVSIGHGIQASVNKQTTQYSQNVITVRPAQLGESSGIGGLSAGTARAALTDRDINAITKIPNVAYAVPLTVVGSTAKADRSFSGVIFAVSSDLPQVLNQELLFGAFFTDKEDSNNVAVLGADAADKMFDQKAPLGQSFTIRGQQYIVSGVLDRFAETPLAGGANYNNAIFVSDASARALGGDDAPVYEALIKADNAKDVQDVDNDVTSLLAKNHGSRDDFHVLAPNEIAGETTATFDLLTKFIGVATIITLLVSGIGIMNVMLVSITERIHEIGIRKAVGATNKQILGQFMTEAATLSIIGSLIGALLALAVVYLLRVFSSLSPVYDYKVAGIACLVAIGFGLLFGSIPAIKAARKDPIAALRSE